MVLLDLININYSLVLFSGLLLKKNKRLNDLLLYVIEIQTILLLGLRGKTVGVDTHTYIEYFQAIRMGSNLTYLEVGNRLLLKIITGFCESPTAMFIVYAIISVTPVFWVIRKESQNVHLSVVIYIGMMYYYFSFNAMRQGAAMSLVLVAIYYLERNKNGHFLLWVLLATSLHSSSVIMLLCWIIKKLKIRVNSNWILYSIVISGGSVLFGKQLVLFAGRLSGLYMGYMSTEFAGDGNLLHPLLFGAIFIYLLLVTPIKEESTSLGLTILGIGVMLYFVSIRVAIVNRLTYYFTISLITLLPNSIEQMKNNNKKISYAIFYMGISAYQLLLIMRGAQGIVPYRFFWQ